MEGGAPYWRTAPSNISGTLPSPIEVTLLGKSPGVLVLGWATPDVPYGCNIKYTVYKRMYYNSTFVTGWVSIDDSNVISAPQTNVDVVSVNDTTAYQFLVEGTCSSGNGATSSSSNTTVSPPFYSNPSLPVIDNSLLGASLQLIHVGDNIDLHVTVTGTPQATVTWNHLASDLTQSDTSSAVIGQKGNDYNLFIQGSK